MFTVFLISLWYLRQTKSILFWIYLWQLKEYHIGRFLDHFRTSKGKKTLFSPLNLLKIILLSGFFILPNYLQIAAVALYSLEVLWALNNLIKRKMIKPVFTKKTAILVLIGLLIELLFVFLLLSNIENVPRFVFYLLIFDILTPLIVSFFILLFQPLAVLGRNQIIKKAKKKRESFKKLLVIGITGSYGKTSAKEFLAAVLSEKFKVLKTKEHQNSEVGISQCILNDLKEDHEIFVCEMGAYNRGGIKLLADIAKPKMGILTGINEQHMATFGSQDNIIKTKYELIESLPGDGVSFFNGDNEYCLYLYNKTKKPKRIFIKEPKKVEEFTAINFDFWIENITFEKEWVSFSVFSKEGKSVRFKVNVLGEHNISNILAAVSVAKELGMTLEEISRAFEKIGPWNTGMELKKGIEGFNIISATYSANPNGVISHLEYLKLWPRHLLKQKQIKRVIVVPCLIELGGASKEIHRRIGRKIGEVCDLAIITTKERLKEIKEGAKEQGMAESRILFIENPELIFKTIRHYCSSDDVVLLEGRVPEKLTKKLTLWDS